MKLYTTPLLPVGHDESLTQGNMRSFARFLIGVGLLAAIFYGILYLQTGAWQILTESGFILLGIAAVGFAYSLIGKNKFREASTWMMIGITIAYALPELVWENATAYLLVTGLLTLFTLGITYPPQKIAWALVPLFHIIFMVAANALSPLSRYDINQSPVLRAFIPGVTGVIVVWGLWQLVQIVARYSWSAVDIKPLSSTLHMQANRFDRLWNAPFWLGLSRLLVEPDDMLEDIASRREAQLLATLLLILIPSYIVGEVVSITQFNADAFSILIILLSLLVSYGYSRTNQYRVGSFLTVVALTASVFTSILPSSTTYTEAGVLNAIVWIFLPLFLSTIILPMRFLIAYLIINVITMVAMASIPGFPLAAAGNTIALLVVASLLIIIGRRFRDRVDQESRMEIFSNQNELALASQKLQESEKAARTLSNNLILVVEISQRLSAARTVDEMLNDAVEIIRSGYGLYYVQVYLTDASQTHLILRSSTGNAGKQFTNRLPLDAFSIIGRAAVERKSVVIADAATNAMFVPNPLLPKTCSEMAVPLVAGEKVVGVLDMQSEHAGSLNEEVLPAYEALAGQLAIAIQNTNLLSETEQARAEVEKQARRLSRANWREYLDAIHKPEQIGVIYDQAVVKSLAETGSLQNPIADNAITVPIVVTGEMLGNLKVELGEDKHTVQTTELINSVSRQVSQQIESLRLLESAERYRAQTEESSRRLTREGWQKYAEHAGNTLSYIYDLKEVRPYRDAENQQPEEDATTLPLKIRDEVIGQLALQGIEANATDSIEFANAVVERLSSHIESLRQFDETQRSQMELDKRARQLAAVAEISTASAKELDVQKMLETVVFLTQRKFQYYHAHVFTFDETSEELKIAACGWKEGDEHEGTHGTTVIPLMQEQSLVARAARTRQAVIVNDVHNEAGWLPNPLLPESRAEMAVPLIVGDRILGVLDVQSDRINTFTQEDANIQTTLASQVATALQNAYSYSRAQKQAERESMLNIINQRIQSATTVEAVLQIAARELGRALNAPLTVAQIGIRDEDNPVKTKSV